LKSTERTGERIIGEAPEKLLELGDEITFEGRHFGIKLRLTSKITEFDFPHRFVDEMVRGPFKRLWHEHRFSAFEGGTEVTDEMRFELPFGALGWLVEGFVAWHLRHFLECRGRFLKAELER
jgi:ligand-binding SRPBCC domain-containing protein